MKNLTLTDILSVVVGLIAFAVTIWQAMLFVGYRDARGISDMWGGLNHLWMALAAAAVACACVVIYFVRHVKEPEEIHITR